eukprot:13988575-Heterocapsa_arctica.AAC.1
MGRALRPAAPPPCKVLSLEKWGREESQRNQLRQRGPVELARSAFFKAKNHGQDPEGNFACGSPVKSLACAPVGGKRLAGWRRPFTRTFL